MGALKVGDVVTAWDATPTEVTGVYPQGKLPIYKVTFWDGRSVETCGEHLWQSFYVNTSVNQRWKIRNTLELKRLVEMPNPRVYVPLIEAEDGPDIELPMDPYTLGVILGDGSTMCGVNVTKMDDFIFDKLEAVFPAGLSWSVYNEKTRAIVSDGKHGNHPYRRALKDLGLMGKQAWLKFIPEEYLLNPSRRQRLALLQGLMDTDGTANTLETGGAISFCSTSLELAEGVQYLVRSLGGIASISRRQTQYTHNGVKKLGRKAWEVNIRHKKPSELFTLPRKKERTNDDNQYAKELKLRVRSVEYIGDKEAQCISVSHPDRLYVANEFIVTHNTFCALAAIATIGLRTVVIVKAQFLEKWVDDVHKTYDLEPEDVIVIRGSSQLQALLMMAKNDELESKFVVVSNKTIQNWLKLYERFRDGTFALGYEAVPEEFFAVLKAGVRLIDEVHMDFHLNFKIDTYTNVQKSISLSATLIADDDFLANMYRMTYPLDTRFAGLPYDKYVHCNAVMYQLKDRFKIKGTDPATGKYSHNYFEQQILKYPLVASNYMELIDKTLKSTWYHPDNYQPGDRVLILCASIDFCSVLTAFLKKRYPHLDVRRYVEDDPYENLLEPDIRVSTMLSAGTGHDIPALTSTLLTTAMRTSGGNIQGLGRLRKIEGRRTMFDYFVCEDLDKQVEYHEQKVKLLESRALTLNTRYTGVQI